MRRGRFESIFMRVLKKCSFHPIGASLKSWKYLSLLSEIAFFKSLSVDSGFYLISLGRFSAGKATSWQDPPKSYSDGRNSVGEAEEIPFEISQSLSQTPTIYEQIDLEYVRQQVQQNPFVTLQELSYLIYQKFGVEPSITHMLRIQRLAGISRILGSRAKASRGIN
jgi:hypothetical protein